MSKELQNEVIEESMSREEYESSRRGDKIGEMCCGGAGS